MISMWQLDWTIYISFLGALAVMLVPVRHAMVSRWVALAFALAALIIAGDFLFFHEDMGTGGMKIIRNLVWIPALGARFMLGYDGISGCLAFLTGIIAVTGILFSWNQERRVREFYAFFLVLIGGVYGTFLSQDLLLFFIFFEIAIIPKYFLISIWGSTNREYAAMKLVLYSFTGSALVLGGILALYHVTGARTFVLEELTSGHFSDSFQLWCFPVLFFGFAVLAGIWPLHTWAPGGHVAAPTAASMLLAGVVMKLGAYGCLRVAMNVFPEALRMPFLGVQEFWRVLIGTLAVIGIVYGAMSALMQKDFKFVIGYSSISHMGFVLLGLMTLNTIGLTGAVLQMISHGLIAGLLFAAVGGMIYERTHTRMLAELGRLWNRMPLITIIFIVGAFASMGMPGGSGFIAELHVLIGTWKDYPWFAIGAGAGILMTGAYTLRVIHEVFFADNAQASHAGSSAYDRITIPELAASVILIGLILWIGLCPQEWLERIGPAVAAFEMKEPSQAIGAARPGGIP